MKKHSRVPASRFSRMMRLGKMATTVASGAVSEGLRQMSRGQLPGRAELLLTPGNTQRIADQLAEMRGAVMKIGQLLSMEAGDFLPRELSDILARLRDNAHAMPAGDLDRILQTEWGTDWREQFATFNEQPLAAASIGQVHEATLHDGTRLAIKIQYPGIANSIDSDVSNAAALLKMLRLLPDSLDINPLLETARQQLKDEADYLLEAHYLKTYSARISDYRSFCVPRVIDALTTQQVLTMTYIDGASIETAASLPAEQRNRLASELIDLSLREFLHWGVVQTDPNFANFRFNAADNSIGLLDFGAIRINEPERTAKFTRLMQVALQNDLAAIVDAACEVGYLGSDDPFNYRMAIADLIQTAAEPALHHGRYDFGSSTLAQRMSEKLYRTRTQSEFQRLPPADVIFLHRKLAGLYLLCARLKAQVDVQHKVRSMLAGEQRELAQP